MHVVIRGAQEHNDGTEAAAAALAAQGANMTGAAGRQPVADSRAAAAQEG